MKYAASILAAILAVLAPIKMLVLTVGLLIALDAIVGVMAAKKRGESITSGGFRRTVIKMMLYQVALITGYLIETYVAPGFLPISKLVASAISLTEFTSVLENISDITGQNIFKSLIEKFKSENDK